MTLAMSNNDPQSATDAAASTTSPPRRPRVVSLIASATEILHALGAGNDQVGRSHECDWPSAVMALPALTRAKFSIEGSSRDIDERVKALVVDGLAVYEVDADHLKRLTPDVILTQDQCEVCAVSLADVERAVCDWTDHRANVVSLRPHRMADVYSDIRRVADAIGRPDAGSDLVDRMTGRLAAITALVAGRPKPKLAFIEWIDPAMSGGHWMPELVDAAGGVNLFGETGATSPWIAWSDVADADPDVVLVGPCGYGISVTEREMSVLALNATWRGLRAVREGRAYVADGNAFFNRPGPRLVESAEILAEILHGDICDFGHRGVGYRRFDG